MRDMTVIVIVDAMGDRLLLRRRTREPYRGLVDFIGGSRFAGEGALDCARRILMEKAGLDQAEMNLSHVMDFAYQNTGCCVQVFQGRLEGAVAGREEAHSLLWLDRREDFFDEARFAGEGYMGHILEHMQMQAADAADQPAET